MAATATLTDARRRAGPRPIATLLRRHLADARWRTVAFAWLFLAVAAIQPIAYRHTYPSIADRLAFAHAFGANKAVDLFYGRAYDLLTVGGYSAWRVGGTLTIFAAVFGMLSAVRSLRADEESGRAELVLAAPVARRDAFAAAIASGATGATGLWAAAFAGLLLGGLPVAGSAYLALSVAAVVPVFIGAGALCAELAPTRRIALELGGLAVAGALLLRVIADTAPGTGWLRWATPLGWAEASRPFSGARPLVLLLPLALAAALLLVAWRIHAGRDIGSGLIAPRDETQPRLRLLTGVTAEAFRDQRLTLLTWVTASGAFGLVVGVLSTSDITAGLSAQLRRRLASLASGSLSRPSGYIGLTFVFFVLVACLFAISQIASARGEESSGRLETVLALPVGRVRWLSSRLALGSASVALLSLSIALLTWAGARSQGAPVALGRMLEAGANCLAPALLFLGIGALAFAVAPRAASAIGYAAVTVAFLWQLFGALLGAPHWLVQLTPFAHLSSAPAQALRVAPALTMAAAGAVLSAAALAIFRRRDLQGG